MKPFTVAQAALWLDLPAVSSNTLIQGVSIDTRTLQPGDVFVALKGEKVDGHTCVAQAQAKGAVCAIVEEPVDTPLPVLNVSNTQKALGQLAAAYRAQFAIPVIGLTGSVGKTTTKEMLVHLLSQQYSVLASVGNQNNELGVPLTLLRLSPEHEVAVIEMGARQQGDIAYLAHLAKPTIGLITNIGVAHIEIFGSVERIAAGKTELFSALPTQGTAVLAMDDPYLAPWRSRLNTQQVTVAYRSQDRVDMRAQDSQPFPGSIAFSLTTPEGQFPIRLNLPGEHNIQNALLAAGAAYAAGLSAAHIQAGLNSFQAQMTGRLALKKGRYGARIIDDTYNANPVSMQAAIGILAQYPGKQIVIMGDMLELGNSAIAQHQAMGEYACQQGIHHFFGLGPLSAQAAMAFGDAGQQVGTVAELLAALDALLVKYQDKAVVLVKGSRGMAMEKVVEALC